MSKNIRHNSKTFENTSLVAQTQTHNSTNMLILSDCFSIIKHRIEVHYGKHQRKPSIELEKTWRHIFDYSLLVPWTKHTLFKRTKNWWILLSTYVSVYVSLHVIKFDLDFPQRYRGVSLKWSGRVSKRCFRDCRASRHATRVRGLHLLGSYVVRSNWRDNLR